MISYPNYPQGYWSLPIAIASNAYHFFPEPGKPSLCGKWNDHMRQLDYRLAVKSVDCKECREIVDPVTWLKLTDGQWRALRGSAIYDDPKIDCRTMQAHGGRALAVRALHRRGLMRNNTISLTGIAFFEKHCNERAVRKIFIPACDKHDGRLITSLLVNWHCIECGAIRGEPFNAKDWDGDKSLSVTAWKNPCGHVETYAQVREHEAQQRGEGQGA